MSENLSPQSLTEVSAVDVPLPGAVLRAQRERRGLTMEAIAQVTRFSVRQVDALERDDYDSLPGMTTVRGFVRSYAKYLQIDATPYLVSLDSAAPLTMPEVNPPGNMGTALQGASAPRRMTTYLMAVGIAALVALVVYGFVAEQGHQPALVASLKAAVPALNAPKNDPLFQVLPSNAPAVSAEPAANASVSVENSKLAPIAGSGVVAEMPATGAALPILPGVSENTTSAAASHTAAAAATIIPPSASALRVVFDGLSWIEVRDATRKIVLNGEFSAGMTHKVEGKPPFQVWVGKASVVRIFFGERSIDLQPFTRADVARLTVE